MRNEVIGLVLLAAAGAAWAQAPARETIQREQALSGAQLRAGAAYQEMQEARQNAIRAEADLLNAQDANRVAQKQAAETKQQLDAARQALDAAKARDAKARKAYDDALDAVDRARKMPAAK
jgi:chromosome segregation ATPase